VQPALCQVGGGAAGAVVALEVAKAIGGVTNSAPRTIGVASRDRHGPGTSLGDWPGFLSSISPKTFPCGICGGLVALKTVP
jgi:hypothetical protein